MYCDWNPINLFLEVNLIVQLSSKKIHMGCEKHSFSPCVGSFIHTYDKMFMLLSY